MTNEENRKYYFDSIIENQLKVKLIIMGQDPYKTGANGIPFCKNDFGEFTGTCFLTILSALGIEMDTNSFNLPIEFFNKLAKEEGVVFLNLSYTLLDNLVIEKVERIKEGIQINRILFDKLKSPEKITFLKLGKTKLGVELDSLLEKLIADFNFKTQPFLFHPAYTRIKSDKKEDLLEWVNTWKMNGLKKYLNKN